MDFYAVALQVLEIMSAIIYVTDRICDTKPFSRRSLYIRWICRTVEANYQMLICWETFFPFDKKTAGRRPNLQIRAANERDGVKNSFYALRIVERTPDWFGIDRYEMHPWRLKWRKIRGGKVWRFCGCLWRESGDQWSVFYWLSLLWKFADGFELIFIRELQDSNGYAFTVEQVCVRYFLSLDKNLIERLF